jgi:uracil-DNA glycosylase
LDSADLWTNMKNCTRCPLRKGCNQVVVGIGPLCAPLLIVGEAPGGDEDIEGEPFVGRSGQLLTKLLSDGGIDRETIYVSNAVKCRPPANRVPSPIEINTCKIWLWREIQTLSNLKVILTLGATPTGLLLKLKTVSMGKLINKGYTVDYTSAKVYPWYHPSYILRRNKGTSGTEGTKLIDSTVDFFKKIKEQI